MATCLFNEGNSSVLSILKALDLKFNKTVLQNACFKDKERIGTSEKRAASSTKEARKTKRIKLAAQNEQYILKEGVSYSTGDFA
ncbi:hypothetical protein JTE90_015856 [Oedothorax gibbosus]|uniref:Uncharacterized protein n=1 Tax=Oedothorax gibbosus TaxID=931172 RepID=A0AAV6VVV4_9ARAC|nr:hypothetical protein JTE90_015856 [Oedothorax gibbosus]